MKIKWLLFLILAAILLILGMSATQPVLAGSHQQEATSQPTSLDGTPAPRPPSEAGQNMVLIMGAVMLVLIIFFGVALHSRSPRQRATPEH